MSMAPEMINLSLFEYVSERVSFEITVGLWFWRQLLSMD
jgi:hypothetical protein